MQKSTTEQLREAEAMIRVYEGEITARQLYLANPQRLEQEIAREREKLAHVHKRITLFESYRDDGQAGIDAYHDKIAAMRSRVTLLKNAAAIERLLRLQAEVNNLSPEEAEAIGAPAPAPSEGDGVGSDDLADPDDPDDASLISTST